jgi:ABC-type branched-subunit amino acid transport system ATPase component
VATVLVGLSHLNFDGFESLKGHVNKLSKINILVGPNGSGKSAILRFLQLNTKPRVLVGLSSLSDFDDQKRVMAATYCSIVTPSVKTTLSFEHFKEISTMFPEAVLRSIDTETTSVTETFERMTAQLTVKSSIDTETTSVTESPKSKTETTTKNTVNFLNGTPVSALSENAPGGYRLAARMLSEIEKAAKPKTHQTGTVQTMQNFLCFEEPEIGLHPSVQKEFLKYLLTWLNKFETPVQCFITTHSPYIVSAASQIEECRVYLLKDCQPTDLTGKLGTQDAFNGFSGQEALLAAHALLGSGINDFIPKLTFCENSIHAFLSAIASKNGPPIPSCIQTTTGDSDSINKCSTLSQVYEFLGKHILQNGPSSRLVPGSISFIVDGPLSLADKDQLLKLNNRRNFFVLTLGNSTELEGNYPKRLVAEFFSQQKIEFEEDSRVTDLLNEASKSQSPKTKANPVWVGTRKAELAKFVVENATQPELTAMIEMVEKLYAEL